MPIDPRSIEAARRIVRHKAHPDLPGKWRWRKLRYQDYALEVELPCINGLSAWFSVAIFHAADEAERMMTDGARQEAGEYAEKFVTLLAAAQEREEWRPIKTAPAGGKWVLLWWEYVTDVPFAGYCVNGKWHAAPSGDIWPNPPTHWQPMPSPPALSPRGEREGE